MGKLILFELKKSWSKRSFRFALCVLFLVNAFFLWFDALPGERAPALSAYKAFSAEIRGMTEAEKGALLSELVQTIDGVTFVRDLLALQHSEAGAAFAAEEMAENPGVFEAYFDLYQSGNYLTYTGSLDQESAFLHELAAEQEKVASYGSTLRSIRERAASLKGISVFSSPDGDGFSARNIQKSAEDHRKLSPAGIRWAPSKAIVSAMENSRTDLLLILSVFALTGDLIAEEKRKGLFALTRSTRRGVGPGIAAKFTALLLHCLFVSTLFFGSNLLFFGFSAGWCDLTAKIQSLAAYTECALSVNLLTFLLLSAVTKALVLFSVGTVLFALCLSSESLLLPYLAGSGIWAASWAVYRFIPAASKYSAVKYFNLFGALRTGEVYGRYLNLNIGGITFSRLALSWGAVCLVLLVGISLSCLLFSKGEHLDYKPVTWGRPLPFRPHASLLRYEGYKILIMGRALPVIAVFCLLMGTGNLSRPYTPSPQERYYQSLMLQLEGAPSEEKAALIEAESARYESARGELEKIQALVSSGAVDSATGETMKLPWYSVLAFYPELQRVEQQAELVRQRGGMFLYDTGVLYLLGALGESEVRDFLLLTLGILLAFSNTFSLEHQCGTWELLCATASGRRGVTVRKAAVCGCSAAVFSSAPFLFRWLRVTQAFPIRGLLFPARSIPFLQGCPPFLPLTAVLALKLLLQAAVGVILAALVLLLSAWRKRQGQALLFGLLLLCVPFLLAALGFPSAQDFSLYPLYAAVLQAS